MTNLDPEVKAAFLRKAAEGKRRIGCTEITSRDILPLIEGNEKLGATIVDAAAALYQECQSLKGDRHWAVLSAYLGPIVRKEVVEGRHVRTTMEYIQQSVCLGWICFGN